MLLYGVFSPLWLFYSVFNRIDDEIFCIYFFESFFYILRGLTSNSFLEFLVLPFESLLLLLWLDLYDFECLLLVVSFSCSASGCSTVRWFIIFLGESLKSSNLLSRKVEEVMFGPLSYLLVILKLASYDFNS